MNTVDEEALGPLVLSVLEEVNSFPTNVYPTDFHGLNNPSDERGADGTLLLQFYAGLAVLSRDMHLYLQGHPQQNAAVFENLVQEVHAEERPRFNEGAFPLYQGRAPQGVSLGLAEAAAAGQPSLKLLGDPMIIHEWTTRPGALLYKRSMSALNRRGLQERVCGEGGYYQQYVKHKITAPDLQSLVTTSIVALLMGAETFWVPWAVIVTIILVRKGLSHYCARSPAKPVTGSSGESVEHSTS